MSDIHSVQCSKLHKLAPGLPKPPYPGELGERIYKNISQEAWDLWLQHQTMLINEYRLSVIEPKSRKFIEQEMQKFLFEDNSSPPPDYTPEESQQSKT